MQAFQWFQNDVTADSGDIYGDVLLDECVFGPSPKLGPALIYSRDIGAEDSSALDTYFAGNLALQSAAIRARAATASIQWPTDDEYIQGFREMYPPEVIERQYGTLDPIWDRAAALRFQWFIVRAVGFSDGKSLEVLCWIAARPWLADDEVIALAREFLKSSGLTVTPGHIESFNAHDFRPTSGMIMFLIEERSAESEADYLERLGFH